MGRKSGSSGPKGKGKGGKGGKGGPRGKRAREKAKLDRRWGERATEEEEEEDRSRRKRARFGRSRLLPKEGDAAAAAGARKGGAREREERAAEAEEGDAPEAEGGRTSRQPRRDGRRRESDASSSDGDSDSSGESSAGGAPAAEGDALGSLLRRIGGSKKRRHQRWGGNAARSPDEAGDFSEEEEEEATPSESEVEESSSSEEENEDDDDDCDSVDAAAAASDGGSSSFDPYASHFSRPPLPEDLDDSALEAEVLGPLRRTKKIPGGVVRHLDDALEVSLGGAVWDRLKARRGADADAGGDEGGEGDGGEDAERARRAWGDLSSESYARVRKLLRKHWRVANSRSLKANADGASPLPRKKSQGGGGKRKRPLFTDLQSVLYPSLSSYQDMNLAGLETPSNRSALHDLLALHVVNHVLTARTRVGRHDKRIRDVERRRDEGEGEGEEHEEDEEDEERRRDQGYTRPTVLILLPTRGTCLDFLRRALALLGRSSSPSSSSEGSARAENWDRFEAEYGVDPSLLAEARANEQARRRSVLDAKGDEWKALFGDEVNSDDEFKIGVSFQVGGSVRRKLAKGGGAAGKVSVKLYSEFYRSDVILASPLGLKMALSKPGNDADDADGGGDGGGGDADFLSSIEICLLLRSDVLLMQNWDHVNSVLSALNRQPTKNNDTDFSRVRPYLLAGHAGRWRQTVLVSEVSDPHLAATFKRCANCVGGRMRVRRTVPPGRAAVCDVLVPGVRQVFWRVPPSSSSSSSAAAVDAAGGPLAARGDDLLAYFEREVLPRLLRTERSSRALIYVPSYFDFVALRNLLLREEASFVSVTEYARVSEVTRGRARFLQGRKSILLYTGRAHFFLRHTIKGARRVIFFGLPEHPAFYADAVNMLAWGGGSSGDGAPGGGCDDSLDAGGEGGGGGGGGSCLALFTRYDAHALEGIVGTANCRRMIEGEKGTFLFRS